MSGARRIAAVLCIAATGAASMSPFTISGASRRLASSRRSAALAIATTTPWPGANGLYKAEATHRRGPWRSFEAVEFATLEWVDWFNHRRLLTPIGNIPPAEGEAIHYAAQENLALAA